MRVKGLQVKIDVVSMAIASSEIGRFSGLPGVLQGFSKSATDDVWPSLIK
jgi:hypothetical protein